MKMVSEEVEEVWFERDLKMVNEEVWLERDLNVPSVAKLSQLYELDRGWRFGRGEPTQRAVKIRSEKLIGVAEKNGWRFCFPLIGEMSILR
jgi:hypothetical protein